MQDESRSYHEESSFGRGGKEGAMDKERSVKEERKEKDARRITKVVGNKEEVEGREGVEKDKKRRE